jgi:CDP-diacylglycerol pyrophosphatase
MKTALRAAPLLLLLAVAIGPAAAADPDALWKIVHDKCVPNITFHKDPAPCTLVELPPNPDKGWVVLKDRDGPEQYLVIPTARITGIEDPAILAPGATNYFQAAWAARLDMLEKLKRELPREDISLAINSPFGRSQNQLHIHIDCLRPDVRDALAAHLAEIGPTWAPIPGGLDGHPYRARRVDGDDLTENPFTLLAAEPGVGAAGIGTHTLVVAGAVFAGGPGFVLLDDHRDADPGDRANGEALQDHACALARMAAR